jgi:hypothetical protein
LIPLSQSASLVISKEKQCFVVPRGEYHFKDDHDWNCAIFAERDVRSVLSDYAELQNPKDAERDLALKLI